MATTVRTAAEEDWLRIWPFFHEIVEAQRTFPYPAGMSEPQGRDTWMVGPPGRTTVAVDAGGEVIGSAHMEANRTGRGAHVSTASFMVAPEHAGRGVGRALVMMPSPGHAPRAFAACSSMRSS